VTHSDSPDRTSATNWTSPVDGAATSEIPVPPPPDEPHDDGALPTIPGYELFREIGRGGMGVVFLARQLGLGRDVALKLIRRDVSGRRANVRFLAEAESVAAIDHAHVVRVYEFGEAEGRPYLAFEYLPGGTLADRLRGGALPVRTAAELMEKIALGVAAAHDRGIVHRDLKPGNVLFDAAGEPKVADFGLAKRDDMKDLTKTGVVFGTPAYMSPEQARGEARSVGPPSDVYSLGVILYECLTGRLPFVASDTWEMLRQMMTQPPVRPGRQAKGIPRDLETVCLKCLEKDGHKRYRGAAELADDLARFREGRPILARPVGTAGKLAMAARRNPVGAPFAVAAIGAAAAAVAGVVAHNSRLQVALVATAAERDRADANYRHAREAVRGMLSRLRGRRYADIPRVKELHAAQAEDALEYFRAVTLLRDDPDPAVRADAALAELEAAKLCLAIGRKTEAIEYAERAEEGFSRAIDRDPVNPSFRVGWADANVTVASVTDEPDGALRRLNEAIRALDDLAPESAATPEALQLRATAANNLGTVLYSQKNHAEAARYFREAYDRRISLAATRPGDREIERHIAENAKNLSIVYVLLKRPAEAEEFHGRARTALERLVATDPDDADAVTSLAIERVNWGYTLMSTGKSTEAIDSLAQILPRLEALHKAEPANTRALDALYRVHGQRGQIHVARGRFAEALAEGEKVVEYALPERKRFHRWFVNRTRMWAGHLHAALAEAERILEELGSDVPYPELHFQATTCAMLADRFRAIVAISGPGIAAADLERTERLAVRYLERTKSAAGPAEWAKLAFATDPTFRIIRARADIHSLLRFAGP
jgi:eukaryotic-like serine/threonine-protein kinase